jgi:beta-alanine--pyruvate transaminase
MLNTEGQTHLSSPNDLDNFWMPFSANKAFKKDPQLIVKSEGIWHYNHKGETILDGSSGLFCCPLGHTRKEIIDAVHQQMSTNDYVPPFQIGQPLSFEFANVLSRILPEHINHTFFVNSGSESVDTAIKIASAYHWSQGDHQRTRWVSRSRAYHGVNIGGLSLSGMARNRMQFPTTMPNVSHMRHTWTEECRFQPGQPSKGKDLADDLEIIAETYGGHTIAACFVEPIAGSTGVLVPPVGYLEKLRQICDHHGILLVFDEVITGFGRTGQPFASQSFNVTPDILTMAKALTNAAIPMGAVAVKDHIYDTITQKAGNGIDLFHGYTYSAHPAACAAGIATQQVFQKENLLKKAQDLIPIFSKAMHALEDIPAVSDIRSYGLVAGIDVIPDPRGAGIRGGALQAELFKKGLHVKFTADAAIVAPAFVYGEEDIDRLAGLLRETLSTVKV